MKRIHYRFFLSLVLLLSSFCQIYAVTMPGLALLNNPVQESPQTLAFSSNQSHQFTQLLEQGSLLDTYFEDLQNETEEFESHKNKFDELSSAILPNTESTSSVHCHIAKCIFDHCEPIVGSLHLFLLFQDLRL